MGGDTIDGRPGQVGQGGFNRRWRFLGGDTTSIASFDHSLDGFNRRWRFLGGDTHWMAYLMAWLCQFQSQVAILGWGYWVGCREYRIKFLVSIAGGDSWVGIHEYGSWKIMFLRSFNRRWRFLGGDTPA